MQVVTTTKIVNSSALLAAVAAAAASSPASAADLITKAAPMSTFAPNWQGLYVGGSIGASWLNSTQDDGGANLFGYGGGGQSQKSSSLGFLAGLQAGYNFQDRNFVYGLEADISWAGGAKTSSNSSFINYSGYSGAKTSQVDGLATFRARFGYDFGGTMPYLTFGAAIGQIKNSYNITGYTGSTLSSASKTSWEPGIVVGGGIEHRFTNSPWSIKGEVLWVGFKDSKVDVAGIPGYAGQNGSVKFSNDMVLGRLGLNYRF